MVPVAQWGRGEPDPAGRLIAVALEKVAFQRGITLEALTALARGHEARAVYDDVTVLVHWL